MIDYEARTLAYWHPQLPAAAADCKHNRVLVRGARLMMLTCPECGNNDPQEIYLSLSLEGGFVNDLMANKPTPDELKAYVLEAVWGEHSEVECHACMYHGEWLADDDFSGPACEA